VCQKGKNWPSEEMLDWKQLCERRKRSALICVVGENNKNHHVHSKTNVALSNFLMTKGSTKGSWDVMTYFFFFEAE
jgi:hypothetical protein